MKMLKKFAVVVTTGLCCIACGPNEGHSYLTFVNASGQDIVCAKRFFGRNDPMVDSLYDGGRGFLKIRAKSMYQSKSFSYCWEIDFEQYPHVQYLIMDAELFKAYVDAPLDTLRKYVPILHRFPLTLQDAERMNWVVVYPPLKE